jgi:hypothetical protein
MMELLVWYWMLFLHKLAGSICANSFSDLALSSKIDLDVVDDCPSKGDISGVAVL